MKVRINDIDKYDQSLNVRIGNIDEYDQFMEMRIDNIDDAFVEVNHQVPIQDMLLFFIFIT